MNYLDLLTQSSNGQFAIGMTLLVLIALNLWSVGRKHGRGQP